MSLCTNVLGLYSISLLAYEYRPAIILLNDNEQESGPDPRSALQLSLRRFVNMGPEDVNTCLPLSLAYRGLVFMQVHHLSSYIL
jgi:hypothetical protein